jgi:DNA (cytosine-5)-methyltransferase 1
MRELSLFSGGGGGLLGTMLLGWRTVGYVEWDDYCQRIIAARIRDGYLPTAPIFSDIRAFIRDGYAASYQGMVDVVSAGFPCQPFSVAGGMAAGDDPRNMWPATLDVVRTVRPEWIWLENVPGLVTGSHGYFRTILAGLSEGGYSVRWRRLSAAELGAPHLRDRIWIVAHAPGFRRAGHRSLTGSLTEGPGGPGDTGPQWRRTEELTRECATLSYSEYDSLGNDEQRFGANSDSERPVWWEVEPDVGRVADGVAARVDRLTAIGNGQVPAVVRKAWGLLAGV